MITVSPDDHLYPHPFLMSTRRSRLLSLDDRMACHACHLAAARHFDCSRFPHAVWTALFEFRGASVSFLNTVSHQRTTRRNSRTAIAATSDHPRNEMYEMFRCFFPPCACVTKRALLESMSDFGRRDGRPDQHGRPPGLSCFLLLYLVPGYSDIGQTETGLYDS